MARSRFTFGEYVTFKDPNILNAQIQNEIFTIKDIWSFNSKIGLYTYKIEHVFIDKMIFTTSESNLKKPDKSQLKMLELLYGKV